MKHGNWIPIHKNVRHLLPLGGEYTHIEALISHTLDVDEGKPYSISGYASLWTWSRNKVRKFLKDIHDLEGQQKDRAKDSKRTVCGHVICIKLKDLQEPKDTLGTAKGQAEGQQKDTTIIKRVLNTNNNTLNTKSKNGKFLKPTIEEIKQYCSERGNSVDAESFFHYYEANGWMQGKKQIKKWKSCVITWEKNTKDRRGASGDMFSGAEKLLKRKGFV